MNRNGKENRTVVIILVSALLSLFLVGCDFTNKDVEKVDDPVTSTPENENEDVAPIDSDGDGIDDDGEAALGTDPQNADSDGDGLSDGEEVNTHFTDPLLVDSDGGGINDGIEVARGTSPIDGSDDIDDGAGLDADGDGLSDEAEVALGTDPNVRDTDGDGLSDGAEVNTFNTDPLDPDTDDGTVHDGPEVSIGTQPFNAPGDDQVNVQDSDDDGLSNADELTAGTDPLDADSDGDGLTDGAEVNTLGTDPLNADTDNGGVDDGTEVDRGTNPLDENDDDSEGVDSDGDGLTDVQEIALGTDIDEADTDGDGLTDGAEVQTHLTDPLKKDTDEGGEEDGSEVDNGRDPLNPVDDNPYMALAITFTDTPASETDATGGQIVFKTADSERVEAIGCAIDAESETDLVPCDENTPFTFTDLELGSHIFTVAVLDTNGYLHIAEYQWEIVEPVMLDPCTDGRLVIETFLVEFDSQQNTCAWGVDPNLKKKNAYSQATIRQEISLDIPESATICGMEYEFEAAPFQFDDHFVLAWNDVALATNRKQLLVDGDSGFKVFDFEQIKGSKFGGDVAYCLGQDGNSVCTIPAHDSGDTMNMSLDQEVVDQVRSTFEGSAQVLTLDVIGDNDRSDCKHDGLEFKVKVSYSEALNEDLNDE